MSSVPLSQARASAWWARSRSSAGASSATRSRTAASGIAGRPSQRAGGQPVQQQAGAEAGAAPGELAVVGTGPGRAGDVQVGPAAAAGELAQEQGGHDRAGLTVAGAVHGAG